MDSKYVGDHSVTEIALTSPLVEFAEGDILPDIFSLQSGQICNDAVILAKAPLTIKMPMQQWAYGLLIPIDRSSIPNGINSLMVKINLAVRRGEIGVAGVDDSLSTLTTSERVLGAGHSVVTLMVPNPEKTKAIFIRTTSNESVSAELSVFKLSTHKPAALQLTPRRHSLNYDLIVVLSSVKTASQTLENTILALDSSAQVRRLHFISDKGIAYAKSTLATSTPNEQSTSNIAQANEAEEVAREIKMVRNLRGSIGVVTGVRDPIDQAIASTFHSIPTIMPYYAELHAAGPWLVKLLTEVIVQNWEWQNNPDFFDGLPHPFGTSPWILADFFSNEFTAATQINVLHHPFDFDAGYTILTRDNMSVFLYRTENIGRSLAVGLSEFLGNSAVKIVTANTSSAKPYAGLYRDFRSSFRVPDELCRAIYRNDYGRHFYSGAEIAAFISKWSQGIS